MSKQEDTTMTVDMIKLAHLIESEAMNDPLLYRFFDVVRFGPKRDITEPLADMLRLYSNNNKVLTDRVFSLLMQIPSRPL